jgi:hypothetical protein
METHVGVDASAEPRFWFVIDRAIAHQFGVSIVGPPAAEVFSPISRRLVLEAMSESIAWHRANDKAGHSSVLNGCRAWRYADDGELGSKNDAAKWARKRWSDPSTIDAALQLRDGRTVELPAAAVATFLDSAEAAVTAALT